MKWKRPMACHTSFLSTYDDQISDQKNIKKSHNYLSSQTLKAGDIIYINCKSHH